MMMLNHQNTKEINMGSTLYISVPHACMALNCCIETLLGLMRTAARNGITEPHHGEIAILDSGAKLYWSELGYQFTISGYAHDGSDVNCYVHGYTHDGSDVECWLHGYAHDGAGVECWV